MDPILKDAIKQANYRSIYINHKEKLLEILDGELLYPHNGGLFKLTISLLTELKFFLDEGKNEATILDINQEPILITELQTFFEETRQHRYEVINNYKIGLGKLNRSRSIKTLTLLEIEDDNEE